MARLVDVLLDAGGLSLLLLAPAVGSIGINENLVSVGFSSVWRYMYMYMEEWCVHVSCYARPVHTRSLAVLSAVILQHAHTMETRRTAN